MNAERVKEIKDPSFTDLNPNVRNVYSVLFTHTYMNISKIKETAKEQFNLTPGQVEYALAELRRAGWAEWQRGNGPAYQWKSRKERLLVPQKQGKYVPRASSTPRRIARLRGTEDRPLEALSMSELIRRLRQLQDEAAQVYAVLDNRIKLLR